MDENQPLGGSYPQLPAKLRALVPQLLQANMGPELLLRLARSLRQRVAAADAQDATRKQQVLKRLARVEAAVSSSAQSTTEGAAGEPTSQTDSAVEQVQQDSLPPIVLQMNRKLDRMEDQVAQEAALGRSVEAKLARLQGKVTRMGVKRPRASTPSSHPSGQTPIVQTPCNASGSELRSDGTVRADAQSRETGAGEDCHGAVPLDLDELGLPHADDKQPPQLTVPTLTLEDTLEPVTSPIKRRKTSHSHVESEETESSGVKVGHVLTEAKEQVEIPKGIDSTMTGGEKNSADGGTVNDTSSVNDSSGQDKQTAADTDNKTAEPPAKPETSEAADSVPENDGTPGSGGGSVDGDDATGGAVEAATDGATGKPTGASVSASSSAVRVAPTQAQLLKIGRALCKGKTLFWKQRMGALADLRMLCGLPHDAPGLLPATVWADAFDSLLGKGLCLQIKDLRSAIVKQACAAVGAVSQAHLRAIARESHAGERKTASGLGTAPHSDDATAQDGPTAMQDTGESGNVQRVWQRAQRMASEARLLVNPLLHNLYVTVGVISGNADACLTELVGGVVSAHQTAMCIGQEHDPTACEDQDSAVGTGSGGGQTAMGTGEWTALLLVLARATADPHPEVRWKVCQCLSSMLAVSHAMRRVGEEQSAPLSVYTKVTLRCLGDPNGRVREAARTLYSGLLATSASAAREVWAKCSVPLRKQLRSALGEPLLTLLSNDGGEEKSRVAVIDPKTVKKDADGTTQSESGVSRTSQTEPSSSQQVLAVVTNKPAHNSEQAQNPRLRKPGAPVRRKKPGTSAKPGRLSKFAEFRRQSRLKMRRAKLAAAEGGENPDVSAE